MTLARNPFRQLYIALAVLAAGVLVSLVLQVSLAVQVGRVLPQPPVIGGGVVPKPDPSEQARDAARQAGIDLPDGFVGARITASHNQESTAGPLVFDTANWDSGGWWDVARPTRLTFPASAICEVRAQVTILGTLYEGAPADDVTVLVKRDGDPTAFVAYARRTNQDPEPATGLSAATTDWFEAGEYVEVFVTPEGLTVESNWPGRANVSPVLVVTC